MARATSGRSVAVLLALTLAAALPNACSKPGSATPATKPPASTASAPAPSQPSGPKAGDLDAAFTAAFGAPPPVMRVVVRDGEPTTLRYRPARLIDLGGGRIALVSEARADGCHGCYGTLAVHYLARGATGFTVIGAWPELTDGGSFGEPPNWTVRQDLFTGPALVADAGGTWQGCTIDYADLFELAAARPVLRAKRLLMIYDDDSHADAAIDGKVRPEVRDRAFAIDYSGEQPRTVEYRPTGEVFQPVRAEPSLPSC